VVKLYLLYFEVNFFGYLILKIPRLVFEVY
jgi:hypothetical protein